MAIIPFADDNTNWLVVRTIVQMFARYKPETSYCNEQYTLKLVRGCLSFTLFIYPDRIVIPEFEKSGISQFYERTSRTFLLAEVDLVKVNRIVRDDFILQRKYHRGERK